MDHEGDVQRRQSACVRIHDVLGISPGRPVARLFDLYFMLKQLVYTNEPRFDLLKTGFTKIHRFH